MRTHSDIAASAGIEDELRRRLELAFRRAGCDASDFDEKVRDVRLDRI